MPPGSHESPVVLLLGLLLFAMVVGDTWLNMNAWSTSRQPNGGKTAEMQLDRREACAETYQLELLLWQSEQRPGRQWIQRAVARRGVRAVRAWQKLVHAGGVGEDRANALINLAAVYGALEQRAQAYLALVQAEQTDSRLAGVARELQSLYTASPRPLHPSALTEQTIELLSPDRCCARTMRS